MFESLDDLCEEMYLSERPIHKIIVRRHVMEKLCNATDWILDSTLAWDTLMGYPVVVDRDGSEMVKAILSHYIGIPECVEKKWRQFFLSPHLPMVRCWAVLFMYEDGHKAFVEDVPFKEVDGVRFGPDNVDGFEEWKVDGWTACAPRGERI